MCIVPHAFGDHTKCSQSWCRWKQDAALFKHSYLPYGKDLHGEELKNALHDIFCQFHSDGMVEKLSPINNSQRNESFNSTVGSKTPKIRYYGGSDSNDFRVASAVAQTNVGYGYIFKTLEFLGIDPGRSCERYICELEKKRENDSIRKQSLQFKKSRNEIRTQRIHGTLSNEKKKGTTYQKNIGLTLSKDGDVTGNIDEVLQMDITNNNLGAYEKMMPAYTPRPQCCATEINEADSCYNIILFDTETNKMGKDAELCQIAAINQAGDRSFVEYILPKKNIERHASKVNNLTIRTINGQRVLFKESSPVQTLTCEEALTHFISFIEKSAQELGYQQQRMSVLF